MCKKLNLLILLIPFTFTYCFADTYYFSPSLRLIQQEINGIVVKKNNRKLVIYGTPGESISNVDLILFTHSRRDVFWAARELVENGTKAIVPKTEINNFIKVDRFWNQFSQGRFHDYEQESTKILTQSIKVYQDVKENDSIVWQDLTFKILDTPGYSTGAVSYIVNIDGKKIAFVGDLIYGDGKIFDLYSLQDKNEDLDIWGYHGYASRIGKLITSLQKIAQLKPDIIIPSRGPIITQPDVAINSLIHRLQLVYKNYLSTSAYRWYSGQEKQNKLAEKAQLIPDSIPWMPPGETKTEYPSWVIRIENTSVIKSEDGSAFLIDCGIKSAYDNILQRIKSSEINNIDGIFLTHYHDDHTNFIRQIQKQFDCLIYIYEELNDIINHPDAYRMPAMTETPILNTISVQDGYKFKWKEFEFTIHNFPGQTIYHDALFVKNKNDESMFFIGDSFSPTGMDDYCLQNRNLIHPNMGYFQCLDILTRISEETWLVNQHINEPFRFTQDQIEFMKQQLIKRKVLLTDLFPWNEPNFGIDEQWARIYPYGRTVQADTVITQKVIILNHEDEEKKYLVSLNTHSEGFTIFENKKLVIIPPLIEAEVIFTINVSDKVKRGNHIVTADIEFDDWKLHEWSECMIKIVVN